MRLVRLVPMASSVILSFAFAACGGSDDNGPELVADAAPPDAPPAPVCEETMCGSECVDTQSNEDHCGACDEACDDGRTCEAGDCVCPPAYVDDEPNFQFELPLSSADPAVIVGTFTGTGGLHALR